MERFLTTLMGVLALAMAADVQASRSWIEGRNYVALNPTGNTSVPAGKVEVMEVFSYGCIACNGFQPMVEKLKRNLPPNAQLVFLPASFNRAENWPMLQRAYFAAQLLGIADRTHQAIYDAVWKTGELAVTDPATHQLRNPQASLADAAHCYARLAGVKPEEFIATANSFSVDVKMRAADSQIEAMRVPGTPCIVINGKYRLLMDSVHSSDELVELVNFLVARESQR